MTTSDCNCRPVCPCAKTEELHDCGYVEGSFACKIRHIHLDTSWAKGDH